MHYFILVITVRILVGNPLDYTVGNVHNSMVMQPE